MARVKPSPTSAALASAIELRAAGRDVLSLGAGEPDFDTPQAIKDAAIAAIAAGKTKYTPIEGIAELKAAIQRKFAGDNDLRYTPSQIIVTAGAKQAIFNLCLALLGPGDEAIIPAPYWVSYPDMVRLADAEPVFINTGIDDDFKISPRQLGTALSARTRLLILNSPSNPTGTSYSLAELQALGAVLAAYPEVVIVADDIYESIHWAEEPFISFAAACPDLYERTVTVNGVSKAYAMTGWRIGYAGGPENLIAGMSTVQSQSTSNPCTISQYAALAALDGDQSAVVEMAAAYKARHDYFVSALNSIADFETRAGEGTFYAFPRVTGVIERLGLDDDLALAKHLLNAADVAVVPGSAFGSPGYLRLSFACSLATLEEAVRRIERAVIA
jgi:aspartate aminotransferase